MRPDNIRRLITEDYADEDKELISKLAEVYNPFAEQITNILNGNIQIDNLDRQVIEFKVKIDSNGVPTQVTKFAASKTNYSSSNVIRVINNTNPALFPKSGPFVTFTGQGNNIYTVRHITGLEPGYEYSIRLELIP